MRYLLSVLIAFFVSGAVRATERPKNFRLDDVVISMEEQRRWPVGYALKVVIHRGKVLVGRTALPCEPCRESEEVISISDAEVLAAEPWSVRRTKTMVRCQITSVCEGRPTPMAKAMEYPRMGDAPYPMTGTGKVPHAGARSVIAT
jgi:hypothetical protein